MYLCMKTFRLVYDQSGESKVTTRNKSQNAIRVTCSSAFWSYLYINGAMSRTVPKNGLDKIGKILRGGGRGAGGGGRGRGIHPNPLYVRGLIVLVH